MLFSASIEYRTIGNSTSQLSGSGAVSIPTMNSPASQPPDEIVEVASPVVSNIPGNPEIRTAAPTNNAGKNHCVGSQLGQLSTAFEPFPVSCTTARMVAANVSIHSPKQTAVAVEISKAA